MDFVIAWRCFAPYITTAKYGQKKQASNDICSMETICVYRSARPATFGLTLNLRKVWRGDASSLARLLVMKSTESQIGNPTGPTDHDLRATDQNVVEAEVGTMTMEKKVSLRLSYRLDRVSFCRTTKSKCRNRWICEKQPHVLDRWCATFHSLPTTTFPRNDGFGGYDADCHEVLGCRHDVVRRPNSLEVLLLGGASDSCLHAVEDSQLPAMCPVWDIVATFFKLKPPGNGSRRHADTKGHLIEIDARFELDLDTLDDYILTPRCIIINQYLKTNDDSGRDVGKPLSDDQSIFSFLNHNLFVWNNCCRRDRRSRTNLSVLKYQMNFLQHWHYSKVDRYGPSLCGPCHRCPGMLPPKKLWMLVPFLLSVMGFLALPYILMGLQGHCMRTTRTLNMPHGAL